jgi:hypothetical protein
MNASVVRTLILAAAAFACAAIAYHRFGRPEEAESLREGESGTNLVHASTAEVPIVRSVAKRRVTEDLIAHRRTLWEAAALFRQINSHPQTTPACHLPELGAHPMTFVPRTDEERLVVQVINYVDMLYHENPRRQEEVLRLEKTLLDQLRRKGAIPLPDSASLVSVEELFHEARLSMEQQ